MEDEDEGNIMFGEMATTTEPERELRGDQTEERGMEDEDEEDDDVDDESIDSEAVTEAIKQLKNGYVETNVTKDHR